MDCDTQKIKLSWMVVLFPNFLGKLDLFATFLETIVVLAGYFCSFMDIIISGKHTAESDKDKWCRPHLLYPDSVA